MTNIIISKLEEIEEKVSGIQGVILDDDKRLIRIENNIYDIRKILFEEEEEYKSVKGKLMRIFYYSFEVGGSCTIIAMIYSLFFA